MLQQNIKELIAYTAELAEQELTADDFALILHQAQVVLDKILSLDLPDDEDSKEVVDNLQYTQQEISNATAAKDYSDAEYIINRYLAYIEEANSVFYQLGLKETLRSNSAN